MNHIDYFKLQAKNLFRDYKTKTTINDEELGISYYEYEPKFFEVEALFGDFEIDEDDFSLMRAQHIIARLVGFKKWTEMVKASPTELELAKLLFDNMHKISSEEWDYYVFGVESDNKLKLDAESKLEIFTEVFAKVDGHDSVHMDYRKNPLRHYRVSEIETFPKIAKKQGVQITTLPLSDADRAEFIEVANEVFDSIAKVMEPRYPKQTRELWDAEDHVDNLLTKSMLPIYREYALSLIEASLIHHVANLAAQADEMAIRQN